MNRIDGKWRCVTRTPMGEQQSVMELQRSGDSVTGISRTGLGTIVITEGRICGNVFTWEMELKVPFSMTLKGEATVEGDSMTGTIAAGLFGKSALTGQRLDGAGQDPGH